MDATQWVLIGFVIVLIILYPILTSVKNKKAQQKFIEQTNSLKRGDKILTTSGVYGTVVEVREENGAKMVVIETGNAQHKSYMTIDAYAIYTVIDDKKEDAQKAEEKKEEPKTQEKSKEEKVEEIADKVQKTSRKKKETK